MNISDHVPTFELQLANGKSLATTRAEELSYFLDSNGASIAAKPKRKGGKSKGARKQRKGKPK